MWVVLVAVSVTQAQHNPLTYNAHPLQPQHAVTVSYNPQHNNVTMATQHHQMDVHPNAEYNRIITVN